MGSGVDELIVTVMIKKLNPTGQPEIDRDSSIHCECLWKINFETLTRIQLYGEDLKWHAIAEFAQDKIKILRGHGESP